MKKSLIKKILFKNPKQINRYNNKSPKKNKNNPNRKTNPNLKKDNFLIILSLVSIIGFSGIVSQTLFNYSISHYIESFWMIIIGVGILLETKLFTLKSFKRGLNKEKFSNTITEIIGLISLAAGILSFPAWRVENPSFSAIKGIVSIIAIVIIFIETWVVKE